MAEAKIKHDWQQTACIICFIGNRWATKNSLYKLTDFPQAGFVENVRKATTAEWEAFVKNW